MRKDYADDLKREEQGRPQRSSEVEAKFAADMELARANLMRHTDLGDFLLSPRAVGILKEFNDGMAQNGGPDHQSYYEYLEIGLTVVETALNAMKAEAKRDLTGRPAIPWVRPRAN